MLYIYRRAASEGADSIAEDILLQGTRAKRTRGKLLAGVVEGDSIICWGDPLPGLPVDVRRVKTLNNQPIVSKFTEAQTLIAAKVPTIEVSRNKPAVAAARAVAKAPFVENQFEFALGGALRMNVADAEMLARRIAEFAAAERQRRAAYNAAPAPAPVAQVEWLGRNNSHVGGKDLLAGNGADYYSKKEDLVEEYRVHMFLGKSIRAGKKVKQATRPDGRTPAHAWIRSFDAGWKIDYAGFKSNEAMRKVASDALKALKLDFGAVDIGKKKDGSYIVLEVNRAPGAEGGTSEIYAKKIIAWSKGELKAE